MIVFSIVALIAEQPIKVHKTCGLSHDEWKLGRVLTGADTNVECRDQMRLTVADNCKLGPMNPLMFALRFCP